MRIKNESSLYFKSFLNGIGLRGIDASLKESYKGPRDDIRHLSSDYKAVARSFNKVTKKHESTSSN